MNESEFDVQQVVIKQINNHEVKLLWDLDWKKISAGFNAESLRTIVTRINEVGNRIAAVRACLSHYRYYLVDKDYNYYTEHWDRDCAFKTLCEMIIWDWAFCVVVVSWVDVCVVAVVSAWLVVDCSSIIRVPPPCSISWLVRF